MYIYIYINICMYIYIYIYISATVPPGTKWSDCQCQLQVASPRLQIYSSFKGPQDQFNILLA